MSDPEAVPVEVPDTLISALQGIVGTCGECKRKLERGEAVFIDRLAVATYCDQDGKLLRFHRKRAFLRGETPPLTFAEVRARPT